MWTVPIASGHKAEANNANCESFGCTHNQSEGKTPDQGITFNVLYCTCHVSSNFHQADFSFLNFVNEWHLLNRYVNVEMVHKVYS